jgi:hypothetical protein
MSSSKVRRNNSAQAKCASRTHRRRLSRSCFTAPAQCAAGCHHSTTELTASWRWRGASMIAPRPSIETHAPVGYSFDRIGSRDRSYADRPD